MTTPPKYTLTGTCNRCGFCCTNGAYKCSNLLVTKELGKPEATICKVYDTRYDGMPIMLGVNMGCCGIIVSEAKCAKDSDAETDAVINEVINNRGCSLKLAVS